ncbi:hypothetical protein BT67DRAFT_188297 [Trichocladium antarcticum]|uniref:Uncharacterized protein n=1 Tax=Trichocladium antarcticum TaxID=1450529 RepID=A0AAN6ZFR0_9PEZI|nr:hypothetical protein BT67DRAFT_188297 [Trichocladium antarcticum]
MQAANQLLHGRSSAGLLVHWPLPARPRRRGGSRKVGHHSMQAVHLHGIRRPNITTARLGGSQPTRRRSKPRHYCGVCANGGGGWDGGPSTPRQCLIRLHKHPGRENGLLRSIARVVHGIEIDRCAGAGNAAATVVPLRQAGASFRRPWTVVGRWAGPAGQVGRPRKSPFICLTPLSAPVVVTAGLEGARHLQ